MSENVHHYVSSCMYDGNKCAERVLQHSKHQTVHVWGIRGQLQLKGWCDDARTGIVGRAAELGSCRAADRGDQL